MIINSARQAWHDCYYQNRDSTMGSAIERGQLGKVEGSGFMRRKVSETDAEGKVVARFQWVYVPAVHETPADKKASTGHCAHQAIAGYIQRAIDTLRSDVRAFGNYLYSPLVTDDDRETAEELVCMGAMSRVGRMTASKAERAEYVAKGALYRYRRMHQGGQSSSDDPLESPEAFRAALLDVYGVRLASEAWAREWAPFVQHCFDVCNDIDKMALRPVAAALGEMKEAA